jgi:hypothetical protein
VRHHEIPELIRVASPVCIKSGLRNAPGIYCSGSDLGVTAVALSRERILRARRGLHLPNRSGTSPLDQPPAASAGLAAPRPTAAPSSR